jgi:hypothetical protein
MFLGDRCAMRDDDVRVRSKKDQGKTRKRSEYMYTLALAPARLGRSWYGLDIYHSMSMSRYRRWMQCLQHRYLLLRTEKTVETLTTTEDRSRDLFRDCVVCVNCLSGVPWRSLIVCSTGMNDTPRRTTVITMHHHWSNTLSEAIAVTQAKESQICC